MKIKFYGVRGSYPVPGNGTTKYGGNTTCVTVTKEVEVPVLGKQIARVIIDAGSGIVQLGKDMVANKFQGKESLEFPMLFTHLHPDHTQGFPFFAPNYFSECHIDLCGMKCLKKHVGTVLSDVMLPPTFPIEYKDLKSTREHHELRDGQEMQLGLRIAFDVHVMQAYAPSHPQQGCLYYKIKDRETGKSVACIWDNESKIGGDKAAIRFAAGADVMIHDTQYTSEEYTSDKMIVQGFGHSTYEMALDNAAQAGVGKLVCIHYNPAHTDEKLDEIAGGLNSAGVDVVFSKEGMEIEV